MFKEKLFIKPDDFSLEEINRIRDMNGSHHIVIPFNESCRDIPIIRFYNFLDRRKTKHIMGVLKYEKGIYTNSLYQKLTNVGYASHSSWIKSIQELEKSNFPKSIQIKKELLNIREFLTNKNNNEIRNSK